MRHCLVLLLTVVSGCSTIGAQVDKGLCFKWRTFDIEKIECAGGRGVAQKLCVVRKVQMTECAVWEWPNGRPETGAQVTDSGPALPG